MQENYEYWRYASPKKIWWKITTPAYEKDGKIKKLSILQEYDLIFDKKDLKLRRLENFPGLYL